mmetsp:Transcript_55364/g.98556  ORF Transcript_55364/g.98556 Transcript_55364/m.98556 type:complete len:296 (-) Transcript_55364:99-986(-)
MPRHAWRLVPTVAGNGPDLKRMISLRERADLRASTDPPVQGTTRQHLLSGSMPGPTLRRQGQESRTPVSWTEVLPSSARCSVASPRLLSGAKQIITSRISNPSICLLASVPMARPIGDRGVTRVVMGTEPLLYYNTQKQANSGCRRCLAVADPGPILKADHLTRDFIKPFECAVLQPNQHMHPCIRICICMCRQMQTHATDAQNAHSCTNAGICMQACASLIAFYVVWILTCLQMRHWCHPTVSVSPSAYGQFMQSKRFCSCTLPFSFCLGCGAQIIASGSNYQRAAMQTVFAHL